MEEVRPRLEAFADQMLGSLARRDQRAKGEMYLRGLMLDGKRKSMQPMAKRLGVDHQQLQQFVSSSTWDYSKVRERVARWAAAHISPEAYAIDDVGFPKDGYDSPGVARMYCGALGKRGNCQIGVSVNLVSDHASSAIDWRLFLPESWDDTKHGDDALLAETIRRRRAKAGTQPHHDCHAKQSKAICAQPAEHPPHRVPNRSRPPHRISGHLFCSIRLRPSALGVRYPRHDDLRIGRAKRLIAQSEPFQTHGSAKNPPGNKRTVVRLYGYRLNQGG